jgi:type III secretion protein L
LSKVIKRGPDAPPVAQPGARPPPVAPSIAQAKLGPQKNAPIIQRELVDANREAKRILQSAYEDADRVRQEAQIQAEDARQRGYEEGYQEGLAAYTQQTSQAILQLQKKEEATEAEFVKLIRVCVEKVLGQEIKSSPDAVVGVVRTALQDARQQREIIVRVHPTDAENLRKNQRRLLEVLARASTIEVREDPSVTQGGCFVVTELGVIDASLERQLAAIEAAVEEEFREGGYAASYGEESELDPEDDPGAGYGGY